MAPKFNRAQTVSALRDLEVALYEDDGETLAPSDTPWKGVQAKRALLGDTGALALAVISYIGLGVAGNGYTITFAADGAGIGSVTNIGTAYIFHFQAGVTTVSNAITALAATFTFSGTYTPSATLSNPGDVFGPLALAGGVDNALFVRSGGVTYAVAGGTITVTNKGTFVYNFTTAELTVTASEIAFCADKGLDAAYLDLSTKTLRCATIVYDKFASLDYSGTNPYGNATTLQFIADGTGAGTYDESAYPVIVFHYQSGVTTVKNFEDAVVASAKLGIKQYGKWTNVLTATGDTFAATNLANGRGYKRPYVYPVAMEYGDGNSLVEGSDTMFDYIRGAISALVGVATGFNAPAGGTIEFKSPDGTKVRWQIARDATGRLSCTPVDLT